MKALPIVLLLAAIACTPRGGGQSELNAADFQAKAKEAGTVLLDVRTLAEVETGYLAGARHLDFQSEHFVEGLSSLDPSATYLVYCAAGVRSAAAARQLRERGFPHVLTLAGGLQGAPMPLETRSPLPDGLIQLPPGNTEAEWTYQQFDGHSFATVRCTQVAGTVCTEFTVFFDSELPPQIFYNRVAAHNYVVQNYLHRPNL